MFKFSKKTIIFAIIFIVLITTPVVLNQYYNYLLGPASTGEDEKIFVVNPGDPIVNIAQNLKDENLIKDAFAFRLLVAQMGIGKSIQAGDFRLNSNMSSRQIAEELTHGAIDIWVTIPEGLRIEEQAEKIQEKLKFQNKETVNFDKKEYIQLAEEGYMFPDTYLIPKDATGEFVRDQLRETFRQKVEESILNKSSRRNLSNEEIIILASLIEREARNAEEKATIAGIIINRLNLGMALDIDATVQYAKGYDSAKNSWWPQITRDDYRSVRSPFNTYLNAGLPPAPISNPGIDSIRAALEPQETDYLFYLHDSEGKIHYAETIDQHNANIEEFL